MPKKDKKARPMSKRQKEAAAKMEAEQQKQLLLEGEGKDLPDCLKAAVVTDVTLAIRADRRSGRASAYVRNGFGLAITDTGQTTGLDLDQDNTAVR